MKIFLLCLVLVLGASSCENPAIGGDDPSPTSQRTIKLLIPCAKFNNGTDWVYCEPIKYEKTINASSVKLTASLRNQRGTESECQAELYNLTTGKTVPFTTLESYVDYHLHDVTTDNILSYIDFEEAELTIRFRNTLENSTSFVSNNSRLVIFY